MPEILESRCPHCYKSMKLKSRKALGKQAPCPKCKKPFLVKEIPSETVEDYEDAVLTEEYDTGDTSVDYESADYNDDGYDEDFDEPRRQPGRSQKKSGGKKRRKRRRKKSRNWAKPTLLIGGSVVSVTLLGLGIWLVWGLFSKKLDLAYLPPDAISITVIRPASQWRKQVSMMDDVGIDIDELLSKMREEWGFAPKDLKSVTDGDNSNGETIRVIRSSTKFDEDKITGHSDNVESAEHDGRSYYRIGRNALYFPDTYTAVFRHGNFSEEGH